MTAPHPPPAHYCWTCRRRIQPDGLRLDMPPALICRCPTPVQPRIADVHLTGRHLTQPDTGDTNP